MLHVERQAKHHGLPVAERAGDSASRVLARGCRRVQSFRHGADRAHHVSLFDVEIIFYRAARHVSGQHQERRPAFCRFADSGQGIGQPRPRMHAHQRQFARRLGIGVGHARGITLVAGGNELNARLDQRVRDFEIGGTEQGKAAPSAITGEVTGDDACDNRVAAHGFERSGF